jgi:hypothetical protein
MVRLPCDRSSRTSVDADALVARFGEPLVDDPAGVLADVDFFVDDRFVDRALVATAMLLPASVSVPAGAAC